MKNFIYLAIIPIVVVLLSDRIKASPELIYSLSKEIRIKKLGEDGFENVQQLEVRNIGNDIASNIIVKIVGAVDGINVEKFSNDDVVSEKLLHGNLEVRYQKLLPGGSFSVVLWAKNSVISSRLDVVYEKGRATDAFSKDVDLKQVVYIAILLFFALQFAVSVYSFKKESLMGHARSYLAESLLNKSKPWFVAEKYWDKVCLTAQETILSNLYKDRYSKIETSSAYLLLNGDIESIRDVGIRTKLCDTAYVTLKNYFFQRIYSDKNLSSVEVLLLVKKPKHVDESKWLDIMSGVQDGYVNMLEREFVGNLGSGVLYKADDYRFDLLSGLAKERAVRAMGRYNLCKAKIILCNSNDVSKDYKNIRNFSEEPVLYILYSLAKTIFIVSVATERLPEKVKLLLESNEWLEPLDKQNIVSMMDKIWQSTELFDIFDGLVSGRIIDLERCVHVNGRQRMLVKKVVDLMESEKAIAEKANKVDEDSRLVECVKSKVLSQLDFIDELLSNPSRINRVEEYEDTFSKVNYQNLKKVFYLLAGRSE